MRLHFIKLKQHFWHFKSHFLALTLPYFLVLNTWHCKYQIRYLNANFSSKKVTFWHYKCQNDFMKLEIENFWSLALNCWRLAFKCLFLSLCIFLHFLFFFCLWQKKMIMTSKQHAKPPACWSKFTTSEEKVLYNTHKHLPYLCHIPRYWINQLTIRLCPNLQQYVWYICHGRFRSSSKQSWELCHGLDFRLW